VPSRVVRAEINESESLRRVSIGADLMFRALLVAVDDYGRLDARLTKLKSVLFPVREEVTTGDILGWIKELTTGETRPPVLLYQVDGRPYLWLTGWEKHLSKQKRAKVSKYPDPPEGEPTPSPEIPGDPGDANPVSCDGVTSDECCVTSDVVTGGGSGGRGSTRAAPSPAKPRQAKKSRAGPPPALSPEDRDRLATWAERSEPWAVPRLMDFEVACLEHHKSKGNTSTDWNLNIQAWVRNHREWNGTGGSNGSATPKPGTLEAGVAAILERAERADADRVEAHGALPAEAGSGTRNGPRGVPR